jgi:hypothetical protein
MKLEKLAPDANQLTQFINEHLCDNDPVLYEKVLDWMANVIQDKITHPLVLQGLKDSKNYDAQFFVAVMLRMMMDFQIESDKELYTVVTDITYLDLGELEKYRLVIFNGITEDQLALISETILHLKTNIAITTQKITVTNDTAEAIRLMN